METAVRLNLMTIHELLPLLREADGPSNDLDKAIWYKLIFDPALEQSREREWLKMVGRRCGPYTASMDHAIWLCDQLLPGWERAVGNVSREVPGKAWARLFSPNHQELGTGNVQGATEPLALMIALVEAVVAIEAASPSGPAGARWSTLAASDTLTTPP